MNDTGSASRGLLFGLFGVAVLARVAYLVVVGSAFIGSYHWNVADNLLLHGSLGIDGLPSTDFEPLYPMLLAAARRLTGDDITLIQGLQLTMDALGAVGLYGLATALSHRRSVAVVAAALYAFYPLLIRHAVIGDEFSLMSVLLIGFCYSAVAVRTTMGSAVAGMLLGLAVLTRSVAAPVLPLAAAVMAIEGRRAAAVTLVVTTLAVTSPMFIHNYRLNGALWPTRSGESLYLGNSSEAAWLLPHYTVDVADGSSAMARERPDLLVRGDPAAARERDAFYTTLAIERFTAEPLASLWLVLRKAAYFFWPRLVPSRVTESERVVRLPDGSLHVPSSRSRPFSEELAYSLSYGFVAVAALAGMWVRRGHIREDAVLWSVLVTFVAVHALYIPATRYRTPMEFVLLFYAGCGLDWYLRRRGRSE